MREVVDPGQNLSENEGEQQREQHRLRCKVPPRRRSTFQDLPDSLHSHYTANSGAQNLKSEAFCSDEAYFDIDRARKSNIFTSRPNHAG